VWHELDDRRHEDSEEVRVLYVALTRAKERLILVASSTRGTTPWLDALAPWGYDARNPPDDGDLLGDGAVCHRRWTPPKRQRPPEREVPEAATRAVVAYDDAVRAFLDAATPPLAAPSGLEEERRARFDVSGGGPPSAVHLSRDPAKAAGIVLHRMLEGWDGSDLAAFAGRLGRLCEETARETRTERGAIERDAREIVDTFLGSPLAARFGRIERLGAEVPVLLRRPDDGTVFRGSIDLLYRDGGEVVVADFKTDRERDPEELARVYARQLAVYADAVRHAFRLARRPRTELWMLRTGRIVVLDDRSPEPTEGGNSPEQLRLW
jgi:ATP-dependent helicase/nuclease subunit A